MASPNSSPSKRRRTSIGSRIAIVVGSLSLVGFALTSWLHLAEIPVHFYLPNVPIVVTLDRALSGSESVPQPATDFRITMPTIGVNAAVENLGTDKNGQLETPAQWDDAGWYRMGSQPGGAGVAVIVGHVDSHTGPAVFFRLHQLKAGDPIAVDGPNGSSHFAVDSLQSVPETSPLLKDIFQLNGPSQLLLLTCSGDFNRQTQRYNDRLMVRASAV